MAKRPDFSQKPRKSISNRDLTSPGEVMSDRLLARFAFGLKKRLHFGKSRTRHKMVVHHARSLQECVAVDLQIASSGSSACTAV